MKMPSRILRDKVNMEVIKPWITISWACCTVSVYHVASSERCILMVGAKIPYNTRYRNLSLVSDLSSEKTRVIAKSLMIAGRVNNFMSWPRAVAACPGSEWRESPGRFLGTVEVVDPLVDFGREKGTSFLRKGLHACKSATRLVLVPAHRSVGSSARPSDDQVSDVEKSGFYGVFPLSLRLRTRGILYGGLSVTGGRHEAEGHDAGG
ncbi:hypothetical protein C4D60_Mb06t24070 [Musa balbisiana]|uniref:Uncharacterized protein n=1 Tax=Musa balbisiana TaxID=52838 RepID=A0A4S8IRJ1_MUSBA|nr:hypothetical protein C4D60_Mb06t24070 [Musa balbisiana]